ncbi:MAG: SIR2 family NAD-dependent protein deacylase [Gammaproteobacteria bacterium]
MDDQILALARLIEGSERILAFTGAGISTESGIPDFRSPGGIWSQQQPIMFDDFVSSEEMRREAWRRKIVLDRDFRQAAPNRGHRALAALVESGRMPAVITQNVDGLHQASGVPDERVIELHGNTTYARCLTCHKRYELEPIVAAFERDETLPVCGVCGGLVKSATISFGQSMPPDAMRRAEELTRACDLFVVLGSSLVVYPAAGFPLLAKECGARLAIVNREPTEQDAVADLVIHAGIGAVMGAAVGVD